MTTTAEHASAAPTAPVIPLAWVFRGGTPGALTDDEVDELLAARTRRVPSDPNHGGRPTSSIDDDTTLRIILPRVIAAAEVLHVDDAGNYGRSGVLEYPAGMGGFPWHYDGDAVRYRSIPDPVMRAEIPLRTVSAMALLSDGADYVGGDLQIRERDDVFTMPRERGTVVVFKADRWHRVTPITAGTRLCCVTFCGKSLASTGGGVGLHSWPAPASAA